MIDYSSPSRLPWKAHLQGGILRMLRHLEDLLESTRRRLVPAPVTLFRDVTAPWLASALCVAARLRLADLVGDGPLALDLLASQAELGSLELKRLLEVLSAHGYFRLDASGHVYQTPLSRALSREVAGSFAELQGRGWYRQAFFSGHVVKGMRSGKSPFEEACGQHFFDYLEQHRHCGHLFSAAMDDVTRFCTPFLAAEIRLENGGRVLDVGGGNGELARALAERFPATTLAVLDRSLTDPEFAGHPAYRFHQGSFFDPVPQGYDHLLLKNVLHDWDDAKSLEILTRCREAVPGGARLTVIECLLPEEGQSSLGSAATFALDWNVWLTLAGQERRCSQYRALLERAGWSWLHASPTATPYSLIEVVARSETKESPF